MANLLAYMKGKGMPKEDRDALPYGTTRTDLLSYAKGYEDAKREAREAAKTTKGVPEIGKTYNCFDDGKITNSRLYTVDVKEVVAFDEIDKETKDNWLEQVEHLAPWLYAEKTDYFIKTENGEKGDAVFVRTKCGGWFSLGNFMNSGRLDIDGKLTEMLGFPTGKEIKQEAREVAEVGGWISVDDRLPDVDQDVLLLTGSGIIEGSITNGDWNFITLDCHGHGCGCCRGDSDEVSHWQPLPSEPKTT
jgi:hypothetical protein